MTPLPEPTPHGDPFARIEVAADNLARRVIWEQGNRIGLLRVHAWVGLIAGFQMLAFGGPSSLEAIFGPPVRMLLGVLAIAGGSLLMRGLYSAPRSISKEALGLAVIGMWDLAMTLGLAYARLHSTSYGLRWPWIPLPAADAGYVPPYPIAVYAGMLGLICIHLWTLRTFQKNHAPPAPPHKDEGAS